MVNALNLDNVHEGRASAAERDQTGCVDLGSAASGPGGHWFGGNEGRTERDGEGRSL